MHLSWSHIYTVCHVILLAYVAKTAKLDKFSKLDVFDQNTSAINSFKPVQLVQRTT